MPQADRLRLVVLVHMPLGDRPRDDDARRRERAALAPPPRSSRRAPGPGAGCSSSRAAAATGCTSPSPGADAADRRERNRGRRRAAVRRGGDLRRRARTSCSRRSQPIAALPWHCTCVGSLDRDPAFVEDLRRRRLDAGLGERVSFAGPRTGADLDRGYASADLLVHASRAETYGLVVTEALARGLPVVATEVGGLPEALGEAADGNRPGLLVAPEDPVALAGALSAWLGDAELRARLRRAAGERRQSLPAWSSTASVIADVLAEATA